MSGAFIIVCAYTYGGTVYKDLTRGLCDPSKGPAMQVYEGRGSVFGPQGGPLGSISTTIENFNLVQIP